MRISHEELIDQLKHFRWIDNIPEDIMVFNAEPYRELRAANMV